MHLCALIQYALVRTHHESALINPQIQAYKYTYKHTHTYMRFHKYTYIHTYIHTYIYIHACMYLYAVEARRS